jgi:hypothetical protein
MRMYLSIAHHGTPAKIKLTDVHECHFAPELGVKENCEELVFALRYCRGRVPSAITKHEKKIDP